MYVVVHFNNASNMRHRRCGEEDEGILISILMLPTACALHHVPGQSACGIVAIAALGSDGVPSNSNLVCA